MKIKLKMCSIEKDIEEISICSDEMQKTKKIALLGVCCKCNEHAKSTVLLQKKDPLCRICFLEYCDHKFRSTLGKSRKVKLHEKVLLAYSGGLKSTAMLHMVNEMLASASHKRLVVTPIICYINENIVTSSQDFPEQITEEIKVFKFPVVYSNIEMTLRDTNCDDFYWDLGSLSKQDYPSPLLRNKFSKYFDGIKSLSAKIDFLRHSRLQLLVDVAKKEACEKIFLGDSATDLAVQLLSDVALGRGAQISSNSSFFDDRYEVPLCRPMREFLNKEIALFTHIQGYSYTVLPNLLTKTDPQSSIQRLTETFVCDLQENFPATIFTIFRTGTKLKSAKSSSKDEICIFCKSKLDNIILDQCCALKAFCVSYNLSNPDASSYTSSDSSFQSNETAAGAIIAEKDNKNSYLENLCHACSITVSDVEDKELKASLLQDIIKQANRQKMKEEIQSFLLDEV